MTAETRQLITTLGLTPLPGEGGYYRATWRNPTASAILYLMTPTDFSALHRLAQDEVWHFHAGDSIEHVQWAPPAGAPRVTRLGADVLGGEQPQVAVAAGSWQGARLAAGATGRGWALLGCTVSPPWDERGFEVGRREDLLAQFPTEEAWIRALTR